MERLLEAIKEYQRWLALKGYDDTIDDIIDAIIDYLANEME